ncbi:jg7284 [Pararge aegeria aegeria]|uniref:Jg7284 protein n=1 Tax=Pararge aegeria aegeria TaxID=348720 RepID=A0A8S4SAD6_9NEOP|nr:jg7284 [Pararge aegeria aegeria]
MTRSLNATHPQRAPAFTSFPKLDFDYQGLPDKMHEAYHCVSENRVLMLVDTDTLEKAQSSPECSQSRVKYTNPHWASVVNCGLHPYHCGRPVPCNGSIMMMMNLLFFKASEYGIEHGPFGK